jgi:hypothetical protein
MSIAKSISVFALTVLLGVPLSLNAQCVAPRDMNGVWRANDGGTYYVRQVGNDVWWVGMSADGGKTWTNVFKGGAKRPYCDGNLGRCPPRQNSLQWHSEPSR